MNTTIANNHFTVRLVKSLFVSNMKTYCLSGDRVVIVKKTQGQAIVTMKWKDSESKFIEFTPNR